MLVLDSIIEFVIDSPPRELSIAPKVADSLFPSNYTVLILFSKTAFPLNGAFVENLELPTGDVIPPGPDN